MLEKVESILKDLGNPVDPEKFLNMMKAFLSPANQDKVLDELEEFLNYFSIYKSKKDFQEHIFQILTLTFDICDDANALSDILVKTTVINLIELYLNYSVISGAAKESVLNILGASFGTLLPGPQILNLCVMVDPIFQSDDYQKNKSKAQEIDVVYKEHESDIESEVKASVDNWIQGVQLDLDKQDELRNELREYVSGLVRDKGMDTSTEEYKALELECIEMLNMALTREALLAELGGDDDLSPIPIN